MASDVTVVFDINLTSTGANITQMTESYSNLFQRLAVLTRVGPIVAGDVIRAECTDCGEWQISVKRPTQWTKV